MNNEVVIFESSRFNDAGAFPITQRKIFKRGKWVYFGRGLIALSLLSLLIFFLPIAFSETQYQLYKIKSNFKEKNNLDSLTVTYDNFKKNTLSDENSFELIIPKIAVHTQVKTNVNADNKEKYNQILKSQAAHARGSALPGENGFIYIFGHSTNSVLNIDYYNPIFYLIKKLEKDDEMILAYKGDIYFYKVKEIKIIEANDLKILKDYENQNILILQTCWPSGTIWQRLLVVANPIT
jgi:LPXTG-site transpeptidase (sortase) family protein